MISTYRYQSDFARRHFERGLAAAEAKGWAKALLIVLAARGIEVPDEVGERVTGCTDLGVLESWVCRAVTVDTLDAVFAV